MSLAHDFQILHAVSQLLWEAESRLVSPVCPKMKPKLLDCLRLHDETGRIFLITEYSEWISLFSLN